MNKNIFLSLILFFGFITNYTLAQSVFPLAKGNTWYYEITYQFYDPPRQTSYFKFEVIGDTLMPNGKSYYILEPYDMLWQHYIRSDSQYVYYWEPDCDNGNGCEAQVFNINAVIGEDNTTNWFDYSSISLQGVYQNTLFNQTTTIYNYYLGGLIFAEIYLSYKFGYESFVYRGDYQWGVDIWQLKGCIISDTLYGEITDIQSPKEIPNIFSLSQNYPNPFNPTTTINFSIPVSAKIVIKVYNILGTEIRTLLNEYKHAGIYNLEFDAGNLPSGVYLYKIIAGNYSETKKMILLR